MKGILAQTDEKAVVIHRINTIRKENKGNWYYHSLTYKGKHILIKGYGTWLQRFFIDGVDYSNVPDQTVKQYLAHLEESLNHAI